MTNTQIEAQAKTHRKQKKDFREKEGWQRDKRKSRRRKSRRRKMSTETALGRRAQTGRDDRGRQRGREMLTIVGAVTEACWALGPLVDELLTHAATAETRRDRQRQRQSR